MKEYDRFQKGAANSNTFTAILQRQLENKDKNGNYHEYKIIITTIQKLDGFIRKNKGHEVFDKHIVLIFDECHDLVAIIKDEKLKDKEKPTVEFVNAAKQLDKRINEEYPEINEMHNVASNMANPAKICQDKSFSEYDAILKALNSDLYGILASVLLKHGKISCMVKQICDYPQLKKCNLYLKEREALCKKGIDTIAEISQLAKKYLPDFDILGGSGIMEFIALYLLFFDDIRCSSSKIR